MKQKAIIFFLFLSQLASAQQSAPSNVWKPSDGKEYINPIIHADYSDPDAIRVGDDYYMVSSSFNHVPGIPILHSRDLVHWRLIAHALSALVPIEHFRTVQHGGGVWAPSIRFHKGEFYIYYPDPDFGIYLVKSRNILGPWSDPILVAGGKGLIDPCPLWDDNGKAYLVHAFAGSRAGIKSVIAIREMNAAGTKTIDNGTIIYDGHEEDPTVEGPKFYKRNGYYYIFAPAGGVSTGWQIVLRSKSIYGPYERKIVMHQGSTNINGPHQGAWVDTKAGEHWFLHFQDKDAYGRVVHLQPMKWVNDWPVIGIDTHGDGKGEPVLRHKLPNIISRKEPVTPPDSDEFNQPKRGLQWQWNSNPGNITNFPIPGYLRMYTHIDSNQGNLWNNPNLMLQKFPAEEFTVTTKMRFHPRSGRERIGLVIFGLDYSFIAIERTKDSVFRFVQSIVKNADRSPQETNWMSKPHESVKDLYLRVIVSFGGVCKFGYSLDGNTFHFAPNTFTARPGKWVGAKIGFFATRDTPTNDAGYADIDWFRYEKLDYKNSK